MNAPQKKIIKIQYYIISIQKVLFDLIMFHLNPKCLPMVELEIK